jgi:hypothetical protein
MEPLAVPTAAGRDVGALRRRRGALAQLCVALAAPALATSSSYVPQAPATEWLEMTALRRPGYPAVHANLPLKSAVVPLALDGACGFLPPMRDGVRGGDGGGDAACFPALLNWMYSYWRDDRTDAFLRLVSERRCWLRMGPCGLPEQPPSFCPPRHHV